jgi:HD-GYP domain-containing protein (c-di-GMP phosphodiesterase class II)
VSVSEALNEISKYADTQFDPAVVAAFLKIPVAEIMKAEMLVH